MLTRRFYFFKSIILNKNQQQQGFTIIELLIAMIIVGILAAIALPSILNQSAKAKQSEGKTYVSVINRAQQRYRMEEGNFATTSNELELDLPNITNNYIYTISGNNSEATVIANPIDDQSLKGYSGIVFIYQNNLRNIICQTTEVNATTNVQAMNFTGDLVNCNTYTNMEFLQ